MSQLGDTADVYNVQYESAPTTVNGTPKVQQVHSSFTGEGIVDDRFKPRQCMSCHLMVRNVIVGVLCCGVKTAYLSS